MRHNTKYLAALPLLPLGRRRADHAFYVLHIFINVRYIYFFFFVCFLCFECVACFSLGGRCFVTDVIQQCTKWCQMGVHKLIFGQMFAIFQCESSLIRKCSIKSHSGQKGTQIIVFLTKTIRQTVRCLSKIGNSKAAICSDVIHCNFIICNRIQSNLYIINYSFKSD